MMYFFETYWKKRISDKKSWNEQLIVAASNSPLQIKFKFGGGGVMDVNIILEGGYACVNHLRTGGGKKSGIFANII